MHEASIAASAMEIILGKAAENNFRKINEITLKIGELSGVLPEAMMFALKNAAKETIAEDAAVYLDMVKATAKCNDCGIIFDIDHFNKLCPECKVFSSNVCTGYELYINTIDGE